ncbi:MAG: hypothetical protein KKH98_01845, partial [Spirochaetes bacterium]|nr:hypothetical protein [Spirochaetota bacterium]
MSDNKQLKEYNLKFFLYNFFIVWNVLVIILLIWLNFHIGNIRIKKPKKVNQIPKMAGQFKLLWQSKSAFQNIDKDLYYIDHIKANNDRINDFIALSHSGHITAFDGENGNILFNIDIGSSISKFGLVQGKILAGNTNGRLICLSSAGKELWKS